MRTEPYIGYFFPKGAGRVSLCKRRPRPAYERVRAWLAETTVYRFDPKVALSLTVPGADPTTGALLAALDQKLGAHVARGGETGPIYLDAGGEPIGPEEEDVLISAFWEWRLPYERISDLFDVVESDLVPFTAYRYRIDAVAGFLVVDEKGGVLPGQSFEEPDDFHSRLLLSFCDNSWVIPDLRFPFGRDGHEFRRVWEAFKSTAPFHLNDKYLRLARCKNDRIILKRLQR
jgi:hypothetical protein